MKQMWIARAVLALGCSMCAQAGHATGYACIGTVTTVTTDPSGNVNASFAFPSGQMLWQQVCNVNGGLNNVQAYACKPILANLLTAKVTGRNVEMWFDNATPGNCSATDWGSLGSMGWYWGPALE